MFNGEKIYDRLEELYQCLQVTESEILKTAIRNEIAYLEELTNKYLI